MSKPFYRSKKFWTAIITAVAMVVSHATGKEDLAALITALGATLVAGFGLEDFGKAKGGQP